MSDVVVFVPLADLAILRTLPMPGSARLTIPTPPTVTASVAGVPSTNAPRKPNGYEALHLGDCKGSEQGRVERSLGRVEQALTFSAQAKAAAERRRHGEQIH